METNLLFRIYLDYNRTTYNPLADIALSEFWDKDMKKYAWTFNMADVNKVSGIIGYPIQFKANDVQEVNLRAPAATTTTVNPAYKGEGDFEVTVYPKIVLIRTIINKKNKIIKLPVEMIQNIWNVIAKNPKGKPIKTRTIAEHWCAVQGYTRYHRQTGTFDFQKFFGDRPTYLKLNLSLVALRHWKYISYERTGHITRLVDEVYIEKLAVNG